MNTPLSVHFELKKNNLLATIKNFKVGKKPEVMHEMEESPNKGSEMGTLLALCRRFFFSRTSFFK
jgi:hypothetical protein